MNPPLRVKPSVLARVDVAMKDTTPTGLQLRVPFSAYLAHEAWGSSSLHAMRIGPPARVIWDRENSREDTDATRLGHAVHCLLLTPDLFASTYAHKPEGMTFASKDGKAWRDAHAGLCILSDDEWHRVEAIVDSLHAKRAVSESLAQSDATEGTLFWTCPASGESCKARPDWIEGRSIYDLKVSRVASNRGTLPLRAFASGWMHQLAHYRTGALVNGLDITRGRLVIVDPEPPHFVWTVEVKTDALDLLELENLETLKAMRACRMSEDWPGTPEEWVKVEPPASAMVALGGSFEGMDTESEA